MSRTPTPSSDGIGRRAPDVGDDREAMAFTAEGVRAFATATIRVLGAPERHARLVADVLVGSDLAGHPSHGVRLLPAYADDVRAGRLDPTAEPRVGTTSAGGRIIDGGWGFGAPAMAAAVDAACAGAADLGLAASAVVRSNHVGRLGEWVERALRRDFAALVVATYSSGPYEVAPFGGTSASLSTNPIAFGFPRQDGPPMVGDFATAAIAWGKLALAQTLGREAPPEMLFDASGDPTQSIDAFMRGGAMRTFGGHKGFALAVLVELLASALSSAPERDETRELAQCAFVLALSPALFGTDWAQVAATGAHIGARIASARQSDEGCPILLPGEPEAAARTEGVVRLSRADLSQLRRLARELGVESPIAT
jgi:LDH2 family malate/lactate/ureidoglycolate dehydrogenase